MEKLHNTETNLNKENMQEFKNLVYWPLFDTLSLDPSSYEFHYDESRGEVAVINGDIIAYITREERAKLTK